VATSDEDRIAARREKAIALRVRGKTVRDIAKELGVSVGLAHSDLDAVRSELAEQTREYAETERSFQLARLDEATQLCMRLIQEAGDEGLAAVDRLVKLEDRRAKLLGTDAPERNEIVAAIPEVTPDKARQIMSSLFGAVTPEPDEAEPEA